MKTQREYIAAIETAIGTGYRSQLEKESAAVLSKLSTLPAATVKQLLEKAAIKSRVSGLKTGPQPEMFDAASVSLTNVLLWGPPGRGKSQLAAVLAKRHAAKVGGIVQQIVCPEDTQVSVLAGAFQPSGGGAWQWVDGPVTRALKVGGAVIQDELSHLSPEASTWLLAAQDDSTHLTLPSGEVIEKKPVWFISTQNDTPASLLPALNSRHPVQLNVTLPFTWEWLGEFAPLAERDLVSSETADLRPWAALRRMVDAGVAIENAVALLWPDSPSQLSAIKLALDAD
jgi:MoxR-like ATPase